MINIESLISQAYKVIGRGEKLRPESINEAADCLELMFKSWANKGGDVWRINKKSIALPIPAVIENDSKNYLCIRSHTANPDSEPGIGSSYKSYWVEAPEDLTATGTWALAASYIDGRVVDFDDATMFSIGCAKVIDNGEETHFEFISRKDANSLDRSLLGIPNKGVFIPNKEPQLYLYPIVNKAGLVFEYHNITYSAFDTFLTESPDNWLNAIKYGLAVELGYMNGIPLDKLTGIVNKFQFEYRRAKGSEKEVITSCFVKSLF